MPGANNACQVSMIPETIADTATIMETYPVNLISLSGRLRYLSQCSIDIRNAEYYSDQCMYQYHELVADAKREQINR